MGFLTYATCLLAAGSVAGAANLAERSHSHGKGAKLSPSESLQAGCGSLIYSHSVD